MTMLRWPRSGRRRRRGPRLPRAPGAPDPRPPPRPARRPAAPPRQTATPRAPSAVAARDGKSGRSGRLQRGVQRRRDAADLGKQPRSVCRSFGGSIAQVLQHPGPRVTMSRHQGLHDPGGRRLRVVGDIAHRPRGHRRVGEPSFGEQLQHLHLGIDARFQQAVDLEHQPIAQPHRRVRLLDPQPPLRQVVGLGRATRQQLAQRRSRLQFESSVAARQDAQVPRPSAPATPATRHRHRQAHAIRPGATTAGTR